MLKNLNYLQQDTGTATKFFLFFKIFVVDPLESSDIILSD